MPADPGASTTAPAAAAAAVPLPTSTADFWQGSDLPDDSGGIATGPAVIAPLLRQLGHFPFWRGAAPLAEMIQPLYARAAERADSLLLPGASAPPSGPEGPVDEEVL